MSQIAEVSFESLHIQPLLDQTVNIETSNRLHPGMNTLQEFSEWEGRILEMDLRKIPPDPA